MNKLFYPKLAADNIRKNRKTYVPYILTCALTVAMFYIIKSLSLNEGINRMVGADTIRYSLSLGSGVVAFFAMIFLFYTNSFLVKRRKREFGLFNILGMEKKHLSRVVGLETLYIALISLVCGIGLGIMLDKAMYLLIARILGEEITLGFYVSGSAALQTTALFGIIFLLILLNSLRQIHLSNPIELLRGGSVGEKEPKTKWVMTLLGLVCLGFGYALALTTRNPLAAFANFFIAVILVIIGTYLLFTAGSIALLKLLRRNRRYYYQTRHFTAVSGMIYRMKQNAVGLGNICILSTMVLVMVSATSSMMLGMEDIVNTRYPYDLTVYSDETEGERNEKLMETARSVMAENQVTATREISYTYLNFSALREGDRFLTDRHTNTIVADNINNLFFLPLSEYNRVTGENKRLEEGQILLYSNRDSFDYPVLKVFDREYTIVERPDNFLGNGVLAANIASSHFIVVKDMEEVRELYALQKEAYGKNASDIRLCYGVDMTGDDETKSRVYEELHTALGEWGFQGSMECKAEARGSFLSLYGGFFFLGIFLGALFIMATILIIYYKQISEGYDDRERFQILQKVGMSRAEIKRTIHSQIMIVFFLPLVTAGIHVAFALPMVSKILAVLNLLNNRLFFLCALGCFLVFALLYGIIYALTARTYYRIVSR